MRFYVYGWYEPDGTCFYIGKGKGSRYLERRQRNTYWKNIEAKHKGNVEVRLLHCNLDEQTAFRLEIALIDELNPRANLTIGGEGPVGYKHTDEARVKMRLAKLGRKRPPQPALSESTREKIAASKRGKKHTEETKAKISLANAGRKLGSEHGARIRELHLGVKRSPEIRERMSVAARKREEKKRALKEAS